MPNFTDFQSMKELFVFLALPLIALMVAIGANENHHNDKYTFYRNKNKPKKSLIPPSFAFSGHGDHEGHDHGDHDHGGHDHGDHDHGHDHDDF
ncbi:unnamed protein product [Enterobius vermicularis]|uniref:Glycine-rich protein n=1 Tax=Enterobius vermicularis TaxID=51028 RepID=A0A0N4VAR3_ENTVE|nr:unnamed protein product [Enterobius vermicularis]